MFKMAAYFQDGPLVLFTQWQEPVVIATVRVLGSWIAEETLALGDEVRLLLPFLLRIRYVLLKC